MSFHPIFQKWCLGIFIFFNLTIRTILIVCILIPNVIFPNRCWLLSQKSEVERQIWKLKIKILNTKVESEKTKVESKNLKVKYQKFKVKSQKLKGKSQKLKVKC